MAYVTIVTHDDEELSACFKQLNMKAMLKKCEISAENLAEEVLAGFERVKDAPQSIRDKHLKIYKIRIKNEKTNRGKSGGYRVWIMVDCTEELIIVYSVYNKSDERKYIKDSKRYNEIFDKYEEYRR
ncbi:MAG: hypothetical protein LBR37_02910 [Erysipelotrichaceae bacterium]|jgi:mRNA-degrading endonuclease RelE of RelBE toxin-antitoxin system|nr:hypothetical protein [Erysipelotrichaceae bacterium]